MALNLNPPPSQSSSEVSCSIHGPSTRRGNGGVRLVRGSLRPGAVGDFPLRCCAAFGSIKHGCANFFIVLRQHHHLRAPDISGHSITCKFWWENGWWECLLLQISVRPLLSGCLIFWLTVTFRNSEVAHVKHGLLTRRGNVGVGLVCSSLRPGAVGGFLLRCCAAFDSCKNRYA